MIMMETSLFIYLVSLVTHAGNKRKLKFWYEKVFIPTTDDVSIIKAASS